MSKKDCEELPPELQKRIQTLSIPAAGKFAFGLGRNGSYAAANRGELPVIQVGRLKRVPLAALERMLAAAGEKR